MSYTEKISITIPSGIYDISCMIARSLDPDSGGDKSFGPKFILNQEGLEVQPEFYFTVTPCTSEFKEQALLMIANPEMLYQLIQFDYQSRWNDLIAPTLEDCKLFCKLAIIQTKGDSDV